MGRLLKLIAVLSSLAACSVNLRVPAQTVVRCTADSQCPTNTRCSLTIGQCVTAKANQAPSVSISTVPRALDVAQVQVAVFDEESDPVSLNVKLLVAGQAKDVVIDSSTFPSTPAGQPHVLAIDIAALLGARGYVAGLVVQITPRDETGIGATIL